jgi:hypothetical protein
VTNYPVKLLIGQIFGGAINCYGYCATDVHDIWFTNAAGTPLPFWIESIAGGVATVWLKTDSIAVGGTTFTLHYGNPFSGSASNGIAIFDLFDDFSGDLSLWNTDAGSPSVSGGLLTLSGADCAIDSKATFGLGYAARCLSRSVATGQYCMPLQWRNWPETSYARWINIGSSSEYYGNGVSSTTAVGQSTAFHVREIRKISTSSLVFWHDAAPGNLYTYSSNASAADRVGIRANGKDVVADWVLVRKIIATEPVVTAVGTTIEVAA